MSRSKSNIKQLDFIIGSKKIKYDFAKKYGTHDQIEFAKNDYYSRILIKGFNVVDGDLSKKAYRNISKKTKKHHLLFILSRMKFINRLALILK